MLQIAESIAGMSYWQLPRDIFVYSRLASAAESVRVLIRRDILPADKRFRRTDRIHS
jgi:uncharacterized membrane protein